jgi:quinol monooxygenase YgiN
LKAHAAETGFPATAGCFSGRAPQCDIKHRGNKGIFMNIGNLGTVRAAILLTILISAPAVAFGRAPERPALYTQAVERDLRRASIAPTQSAQPHAPSLPSSRGGDERKPRFGLIVKFVTNQGKRDEFINIMSDGFQNMAGCHSYILAKDPSDENAVWVTEIWESLESHDAAMATPEIQAVIARAKPMRARRDMRVITQPMGGQGL